MGDKHKNSRVVSPESVCIRLEYVYLLGVTLAEIMLAPVGVVLVSSSFLWYLTVMSTWLYR